MSLPDVFETDAVCELFCMRSNLTFVNADGEAVIDGEEISRPRVSSAIDSESCVITGDFTADNANDLANQISSCQLPFNL